MTKTTLPFIIWWVPAHSAHSSINISSYYQPYFMGLLCLSGSYFCTASNRCYAENTDCWTFHSTLRVCFRNCKVFELCALGTPGIGFAGMLINSFRSWIMASDCPPLRSCANFYSLGFLLLQYQKCSWWPA